MKRIVLKLALVIVLGIILTIAIVIYQEYWSGLDIPNIYEHEVILDKRKYADAVKHENDMGYVYPGKNIGTVLVLDYIWPYFKKLSKSNSEKLVTLLNTPESYIWGEIGTPDFNKRIVFYDKNNKIIGITIYSYEGQTYSNPHLNKMKWGMLSDEANKAILKIIK